MLLAFTGTKEIEEGRQGERRIELALQTPEMLFQRKAVQKLNHFFKKEMGLKDKERMDLFLTISSRTQAVPVMVGNKIG